jgi:lysophospholipase L1-like esterase
MFNAPRSPTLAALFLLVACSAGPSGTDGKGGGGGEASGGSNASEGGGTGSLNEGGRANTGSTNTGGTRTGGTSESKTGGVVGTSAGGSGGTGTGGSKLGGMGGANTGGTNSGGTPTTGIAKPARILAVGDSITEQKDSWIFPMQDKLKVAGCEYAMIGYAMSPYNGAYATRPGYGSKRIAAGGFSTRGILNLIKEKGLPDTPDVFLEYLGVNNVYGGFIDGKYNPNVSGDPSGSYIQDTKAFIAMVRAKNPRAIFVLMKLQNNQFSDIDKAIDSLVKSESKPESPVVSSMGATGVDTVDGIHPSAAGATKLAGPVSTVLVDLLKQAGVCK